MATGFPTSLDALTNPASGDTLNAPSHSTQHANSNDAIEALQAKVGVNSSAVTTSLDYKVRVGNPVGEIAMWSTNTAPTGWLLCDGIDKDRSTYSALHSLMQAAGYPYGAGNGSTTFGIPNLLGKFPVGKDASAEFDVLGETGGSKTNALGVSNLPAHTHSGSTNSAGSHAHTSAQSDIVRQFGGGDAKLTANSTYGPYNTGSITTDTQGAHDHTVSVSGGGNGTATGDAFNILPPYFALNFIIRF
jgi:microcystin-dependent protein